MKAIRLETIDKKFTLTSQNSRSSEGFFSSFSEQKVATDFWALKNVNMDVERGEIVGIIGRNGSGKTTLLNILAGISSPTGGKIEINGRVSCLLSLGAGFQGELTGKENIYLNSSILGMDRNEVDEKYHSIVEFSELDGFLDSPLQTYSQGMRLRLGFSIAIHIDFEILLIDEVLSIGDISFQKKCIKKIVEFKNKGKTMIITTQALDIIESLSDKVFVLEEGRVIFEGFPAEAIDRYRKLLNEKSFLQRKPYEGLISRTKRWAEARDRWGQKENTGKIVIESVKIVNKWGKETNRFKSRQKIRVNVYFRAHHYVKDIHFGIALFREDGVYCYGPNTRWDGHYTDIQPGRGWFSLEYEDFLLAPGVYYFSVAIWDKEEILAYDYHRACYGIKIIGKNPDGQLLNLPFSWTSILGLPVFISSNPYNSISIKELKDKEKEIKQERGFKIEGISFLDREQKPKDTFITGEEIKVKVDFAWNEKEILKNLEIWVGIFRSDGIYCQGACRKISFKSKEIILKCSQLRLLPGIYHVSVGLWDTKRGEFLAYHHRVYPFKVVFTKKDHGTIYLEHKWRWKLP